MAIKKTVQTKFGFNVPDTYIRVEGVRLTKSEIKFQVRFYTTVEKPHFDDVEYDCSYEIEGANPIKQAYEHLKTLPEFEGATDC